MILIIIFTTMAVGASAGFKGKSDDCAIRAIAIGECRDYKEVYDEICVANQKYKTKWMDRANVKMLRTPHKMTVKDVFYFKMNEKHKTAINPHGGVAKAVSKSYLEKHGWKWTPTMFIGVGCKVHLRKDELPKGRVIAQVSKHLVCLIDGIINDTHDPSRNGTRCVYGYWTKEVAGSA